MSLPFTAEQFLSVFQEYNESVWPAQILLNLLGVTAIIPAFRRFTFSDRLTSGILGFLWLWVGIVYHAAFFAPMNPAAYVFAILNILQGILFLILGVFTPRLRFRFTTGAPGLLGALFILYALILYPTLGHFLGHVYPKAPSFGLPCPTTIFSFGLLLWTDPKVPRVVLIIPFLWSLIGFSAAVTLGMGEDTGLLIAGVVGSATILIRDRRIESRT